MLSRREWQSQQLPRPVDKLTGGDIRCAADFGAAHIFPLRFHQQKLGGPPRQVPGQKGRIHHFQPACAPQRRSNVPLLVGNLHQRHMEGIAQKLRVGIAHQEAGHIAALYRSWAGTDTYGRYRLPLYMGKQPAGELRQAFDMCENGIGLAQTQLPLLYGQQLSAILPLLSIQEGDGGGVIAGVDSNHSHVSFPLCFPSGFWQKRPECHW